MKTALQATLNPKLWEARDRLKPEVRGALLRIAQDFYDYVDIEFPILDIVITGSNVNYNYTNDSDLDLHLITDYDKLDCRDEADELFDTKRHLYERDNNIQIYGIPVTLYVENVHTPGESAGLYSVKQDRWLKQAKRTIPNIDHASVNELTLVWKTIIDHADQLKDLDTVTTTLELLRQFRKLGLKQKQGEFAIPNLVYKQLRNQKDLARLQDLEQKLHDQWLSVN